VRSHAIEDDLEAIVVNVAPFTMVDIQTSEVDTKLAPFNVGP
jgi:hypothetical protein